MGQSILLKRLTFYSEHNYATPRPEIPLTLHAPGGDSPVVFALLDTGAVTSVFQVSVAGLLGIANVHMGRLAPLRLPDGSEPDAWAFPAEATILGHRIHFEITFCPSFAPTMQNVLGVRDVFDKIIFGFEHPNRMVYA